mmetsp:Transcript_80476/g.176454  ORF Transcript_80476/g.176454 Transcript_80476/m.176454 type:complete len:106 (+) Transcript_80476:594-911(+)
MACRHYWLGPMQWPFDFTLAIEGHEGHVCIDPLGSAHRTRYGLTLEPPGRVSICEGESGPRPPQGPTLKKQRQSNSEKPTTTTATTATATPTPTTTKQQHRQRLA